MKILRSILLALLALAAGVVASADAQTIPLAHNTATADAYTTPLVLNPAVAQDYPNASGTLTYY